jgi:hypothetical protein
VSAADTVALITGGASTGGTQRVSPFPDTIALLESLGARNNPIRMSF